MKKLVFICLFLGLFFPKLQAFSELPTLSLSISRDSQNLPLEWNDWVHKNAEIYVDSTGEQSFFEIEKKPFIRVLDYPKPQVILLHMAKYRYWLRLAVCNQHPTDSLHLKLGAAFPFLRFFSKHHPPPLGLCADATQQIIPRSPFPIYPFSIAPKGDSLVLYIQFGTRSVTTFDWSIWLCTSKYLDYVPIDYVHSMPKISFSYFILGTLFLMSCIGFLFYVFNRQMAYLYYGAYLLVIFLNFLRLLELDFKGYIALLFGYFPITLLWSEGIFVGLLQIFYSYFLIHTLDLATENPRAYRLLKQTIRASWIYLGLDFILELFYFNQHASITPYVVYRLTMLVISAYLLTLLNKMSGQVARFVFWGAMSLLMGILLTIPMSFLLHYIPHYDHLFLVKTGIFIEMLFFTAALAFKNQQMEAAHRQKLEENNALLTQIIEQTELKTKATEAELKHTRAQMRTHLLFNVVNSAKNAVLKEKPAEAAAQLADLAAFMRLSLAHSRHSSVSLGEELKLLRNYIDLEKRRLSDAFQLDWQVENDPSVFSPQIPTLLLQPFVENSILHGLLPKKEEESRLLTIKVQKELDKVICTIEDNGVGRPKTELPNESLGLALTKERILLFNELNSTNITWTIEDVVNTEGGVCGTLVVLRIPIF